MVSEMFIYNDLVYRFAIDYDSKKGWHNLELVRLADNVRYKIKTRNADGFAIKVNKTCVSADGGAVGVFNFISDCIKKDFAMCYVYKICEIFCK